MSNFDLFGEKLPLSQEKEGKKRPKSNTAYRTISEVATQLGVATHVLRFWETKFPQIQPVKQTGGRRYYRPEDIEIIEKIQSLLHEKGYTIRGVQTLFKQKNGAEVEELAPKAAKVVRTEQTDVEPSKSEEKISPEALQELVEIRKLLDI